ncbi:MAG: hypothetical protein R6V58_12260, partial [Planctomycetota bacterium]
MLRTSSSHKEGAERRWNVSTKAFTGDEKGNVSGLECVEVEWEGHRGGRSEPVPREDCWPNPRSGNLPFRLNCLKTT